MSAGLSSKAQAHQWTHREFTGLPDTIQESQIQDSGELCSHISLYLDFISLVGKTRYVWGWLCLNCGNNITLLTLRTELGDGPYDELQTLVHLIRHSPDSLGLAREYANSFQGHLRPLLKRLRLRQKL